MFLSLEQEIRDTMLRIEMDTSEGGASADDLERLSALLKRWTNLCQGEWWFRPNWIMDGDRMVLLTETSVRFSPNGKG
jgi:hypothetical protein